MAKTTVNVTNVNIYQPAYNALGLGPIPAGTSSVDAVASMQAQLIKDINKRWPATGHGTFDPSQVGQGVMAPWSADVSGTAPKCVTDEIRLNFQAWGLAVDDDRIAIIAEEITTQISMNLGDEIVLYGTAKSGGFHTYWGVGCVAGPVTDVPTVIDGILFAFAATNS